MHTFICLVLVETSDCEKCSILVSWRSISVSHTTMLSLVPSNSSLRLCWERSRRSTLQHRRARASHLVAKNTYTFNYQQLQKLLQCNSELLNYNNQFILLDDDWCHVDSIQVLRKIHFTQFIISYS